MSFKKTLLSVSLVLLACGVMAQINVRNGEKIAFLGDSITQAGNNGNTGYILLVIKGLEDAGVKAKAIPAGVSGHKSNNMLERLDRDVIAKKPDWMLLSCGVNDVWHGKNGVPLEDYKVNIEKILDKAKEANIKVMVLTATMIGEDAGNGNNKKLAAYNDFLRQTAKERGLLLADLNADMQQAVASEEKPTGLLLTYDGVHMTAKGNMMMAAGILKAFGVEPAKLQEIQKSWLDIPNAFQINVPFSVNEYEALKKSAAEANIPVGLYLKERLGNIETK